MAQYLLLYHGQKLPKSKIRQMEQRAELDRWNREISNVILDGGNPCAHGIKITKTADKPLPDKPVTSYCIIEAKDLDEAIELSRGAPSLYEGGSAEVYQIMSEL